MGLRNPDRISLAERRARCETVADMLRDGWDVLSKCRECGLVMKVDLTLIAKVSGPKTTLWNRTHRCRRLHCGGWVDFEAKTHGMAYYEILKAPWPPSRETGVEDIGNDDETREIVGRLHAIGCSKRDVRRILLDIQKTTDSSERAALADLDCRYRIGAVKTKNRRHKSGDDVGEWRGLTPLRWPKD